MTEEILIDIINFLTETVDGFEKLPKSIRATAPENILKRHQDMKKWITELKKELE